MIFLVRYPFTLYINQHSHTLHKNFFRHGRHLHSGCRKIKTFKVVKRPENTYNTTIIFVCFYTFEYCLAIM